MGNIKNISMLTTIGVFAICAIIAIVKIHNDEIPVEPPPPFDRDFEKIAESKVLRVGLTENVTDYCIYKATPRGFQLETFTDFANSHNLELDIIAVKNDAEAEKFLQDAQCDIIVKHVNQIDTSCMSCPIVHSGLVILTNTTKQNDTVFATLEQSRNSKNLPISILSSNLSEEKIAIKVANGEIESALCDSALALAYQKAYPRLNIDTSLFVKQEVVWKTNPEAYVLRDSINHWFERECGTKKFKVRRKVYYSYININVSHQLYSAKGDKISAYDEAIKKYSKNQKWDWRFIASIIYEESHFKPNISNPSGAYGLMQLMPTGYKKFAGENADITSPDVQLQAGIRYITSLTKKTPATITDSAVIARYVLIGYTAGIGHAEDAYNLTEKYSDTPNSWENLSKYLIALGDRKYYNDKVVKCGKYNGKRTVAFTNNIINRYKHYRNLIDN